MMRYLIALWFVVGLPMTSARLWAADAPQGTAPAPDQPPAASSTLPVMPETEVVGRVGPPAAAAPAAPGAGSILAGSVFSSAPSTGYDVGSSTTGTLIDVPQIDVPATVDVVTEKLRQDQQAVSFDDVLRDIGGAVKTGNEQRPDDFLLRGFDVTARDFRKDGFRDPTFTPRDFADVQRVEVIKGPSSVLYGGGQPSGAANLLTKNPLDAGFAQGGIQFGSFGFQRYTIDVNDNVNVNDDHSLLFRINAAYQNNDSFRDFGYNESTFVAPALTWLLDCDTKLTWKGEFLNDRRQYDTGIAAVNGDPGVMPISRFLGEPANDFQKFQDYRQWLVLTHRIDDDWSWNVGGYSLFYNSAQSGTVPAADLSGVGLPGYFLRNRDNIGPLDEQYQSVIANLAGTVQGQYFLHHLVLGTEEGWFISNHFNGSQLADVTDMFNGLSPTYGVTPSSNFNIPVYALSSYFSDTTEGVYFQDLIDVTPHWKVLAGARYDHAATTFIRDVNFQGVDSGPLRNDQTFDQGTPRVGVVYEPVPEKLSYYAMYSESFDPPSGGAYFNTNPLKPELGQVWEGGVKYKPWDKLLLSAAGFYITKQNVLVNAVDAMGTLSEVQVAQQRSQGMELEARGQLTERCSVVANYCYTDTQISDPGNQAGVEDDGMPALNVPYNSGSLWTRYNLIQSPERVFGLGLGMVAVGDRIGGYGPLPFTPVPYNPPLTILPAYTRWDSGIYYHIGRFDLNAYFENIFGARYYTGSVNQLEIYPGAPFNVRVQLSYRF
jgi:iron complex outermembrane receptor protein